MAPRAGNFAVFEKLLPRLPGRCLRPRFHDARNDAPWRTLEGSIFGPAARSWRRRRSTPRLSARLRWVPLAEVCLTARLKVKSAGFERPPLDAKAAGPAASALPDP